MSCTTALTRQVNECQISQVRALQIHANYVLGEEHRFAALNTLPQLFGGHS